MGKCPIQLKSLTEPAFRKQHKIFLLSNQWDWLRYVSGSMIFAVDYANNVPVNSNSKLYKSWFFFRLYLIHDSGQLESLGSFGHCAHPF